MSPLPQPSQEEVDDVLLSCRFGELAELRQFVDSFGPEAFVEGVKDERGTTGLHYICGNGHLELADYLFPLLSSRAFSAQNSSGSTPLHWSSLNGHLALCKALVLAPNSPGDALIDIRNGAGYSAVGEAERAERGEVAMWLVGRMILNDKKSDPEGASSSSTTTQAVDADGNTTSGKPDGDNEDADDGDEEEEVPLFKLTLDEKGEVVKHESLVADEQQQQQPIA